MLRKLLDYFSLALVVHLITGGLTKIVELLVIGSALTTEQFGDYQLYVTVVELAAGVFIVGFDHALITYINREEGNDRRFIRLFLAYGLLLSTTFGAAGALALGVVDLPVALGLAAVGPFVTAELGKLIFRARLEKAWELSLQGAQSLTWSVGSALTVMAYWLIVPDADRDPEGGWAPAWVPIFWGITSCLGTALAAALVLRKRLHGAPEAEGRLDPFGARYAALWMDYRPIWLGGVAFIVNIQIAKLITEIEVGREALGRLGYVAAVMTFFHKPLALVQRAALPLFTQFPDEVPGAFRNLIRINHTAFPLLAIAILAAYDLMLRFPGPDKFADTWIYLAIIISPAPIFTAEYLVATVAVARGHARNTKTANIRALFVNVPLSFLLVHAFGLAGAAIASAAYPALFAALMIFGNRRELPEYAGFAARSIVRATLWIWAAIGLMWWSGEPLLWSPVAAAVYLAGSVLTGLWTPDQLRHARAMVRRFLARRRADG